MRITVNERELELPAGAMLHALWRQHKPDADVVVINGAPASGDQPLADGDSVVLIRRGEIPSLGELEHLMAARHTPGVHRVLRAAVVGIAGVGGLGSSVAIALARVGVGRLVLADFDVVEPSNLNRQQFFIDQIGLPKVQALRDNLARINPHVAVEAHQVRLDPGNIPGIFADALVLVEAFDAADQKAMLVETYLARVPKRPVVAASGLAGHMPSNSVVTRRLGARLVLVGDRETGAAQGTGLMAPRVGVAAHHQANAVLRLLLGEDPEG